MIYQSNFDESKQADLAVKLKCVLSEANLRSSLANTTSMGDHEEVLPGLKANEFAICEASREWGDDKECRREGGRPI